MQNKERPKITIALIVIQAALFIWLSFGGRTEDAEYMLAHGAMYVPYVRDGHYILLFTSMFLHFGFEHLMNNMLTLAVMGWNLEPVIGPVRFLLFYLCSGIGGNLLSMAMDVQSGEYVVSAGASGAIFGLTGALLCMALKNRGRVGNVSGRGMLLVVAINLYLGFTETGVDNAAHVGGLLTGFVLAFFFGRQREQKHRSFADSGECF